MSFLLDTNVISESVRSRPDSRVVAWLRAVDEDDVFLSVVTIAELRHGVERLARGRRRADLGVWLDEDLPARFEGRVLPIDRAVGNAWGRLVAGREAAGRPMSSMDAFIAATALAHDLTLVTRNERVLAPFAGAIVNPWT